LLKKQDRNQARKRRHRRVRKAVTGTAERPRLAVFRSLNHIYAQIIDDDTGRTLVSASTLDAETRGTVEKTGNVAAAQVVGSILARRALARGIKAVVFDRGGYIFHGRVAALAKGAREGGLEF
jgi:large subunit ribosomal protein L18